MANYKTHRNIGVLSTISATIVSIGFINIVSEHLQGDIKLLNSISLYLSDIHINFITIALMVILGIIGSLFPDIDLKTSRPSKYFRMFIYFLTTIFVISLLMSFQTEIIEYFEKIPYIVVSFVAIITSIFLSYLVIKFFENTMIHRGIVHSVPFGIVSSIVLFEFIQVIKEILNTYNLIINIESVLISFIFFIGFITHLVLDEAYSVNLMDARLKKSFGTAFKFYDKKNKYGTFILWTIIAYYIHFLL